VGAQSFMGSAIVPVAQPIGAAGAGGINLTVGPNVINNGMDLAEFDAHVERTVAVAMAGA